MSTWAAGGKWQPEVKCSQWHLPKFQLQAFYILIPMRKYQPLIYFATLVWSPKNNNCLRQTLKKSFSYTFNSHNKTLWIIIITIIIIISVLPKRKLKLRKQGLAKSLSGNDQVKAQAQIIFLQVIHWCTLQTPSILPDVVFPKISNSYPLL